MAAIIRPHHLPALAPVPRRRRTDLHLVPGTGSGAGAASTPAPWAVVLGLVLVLAVAFGAVAVGRGALAGLAPEPPAATPAELAPADAPAVVARPGDTLWSIARRIQPTGDVRPLVDRLVAVNGTAALQVGQRVVVPN